MEIIGAVAQLFFFFGALALANTLWAYYQSPIKKIPGPFLAKFTNLWRFFDNWGGRPELTHQLLHAKYGSAVRLGPDLVSLSDPALMRKIYDSRGQFRKTEFYSVNDAKVGSTIISNVFSTRSNADHTQKRSLLTQFYKMSHLLKSESLVDDTIDSFCKHLDRFADEGTVCKMDEWLLFFAWDVISQLTFSRPMGFMDEGKDYSGLLGTADKALDYFSVIGQIPALDKWLAKNPIMPIGPPSFDAAAGFCAQQSISRQQAGEKTEGKRDMLDDFLQLKKQNPLTMDDNGVIGAVLVNVLAGADTTAIVLRAVVYYTLKNPIIYRKLQQELDDANLTAPLAYAAVSKLPYFDAVIRESCRFHPGVGLLLERIVPDTGLQLADGTFLPAGTKVGMNPWVIHKNKTIYGQDAESFRPERWLRNEEGGETDEAYAERLATMKRNDLCFGTGKRVCIGKDISIMEMYKTMATLFKNYEMNLVDPEKEWHVQNSWFVRQTGINVKVQRRKPIIA
ncbi:uncharacterized protein BP5553_10663 [Venustampulla echinocandica]|uniref:Cytochrome P450 n=1 Tax=Venustampulla echinocandica TaxID=2656787 RepID=A0A370T8Q1_9HELO|nr:uncharacterized protein BP5553_10663 [Venustampulla echinocandica]RDL29798.1 hypothetical protein BP5553_10663 [Venustampulla echinocandica]